MREQALESLEKHCGNVSSAQVEQVFRELGCLDDSRTRSRANRYQYLSGNYYSDEIGLL